MKLKSLSGESSNSFGLIFARLLTKLRHKSGLAKCMLAKCVVSSNGVRVVVLNKCPMLGQHTVWWVTCNLFSRNFSETWIFCFLLTPKLLLPPVQAFNLLLQNSRHDCELKCLIWTTRELISNCLVKRSKNQVRR